MHRHSFILYRFEDIATSLGNAFVENNRGGISERYLQTEKKLVGAARSEKPFSGVLGSFGAVTYRDVIAPLRTVLNHEYQWKPSCIQSSWKLPCYIAACSTDVRCVKLLNRIWFYYNKQDHR